MTNDLNTRKRCGNCIGFIEDEHGWGICRRIVEDEYVLSQDQKHNEVSNKDSCDEFKEKKISVAAEVYDVERTRRFNIHSELIDIIENLLSIAQIFKHQANAAGICSENHEKIDYWIDKAQKVISNEEQQTY